MTLERINGVYNELDSICATRYAEIKALKKSQIFTFKISELKLSAALILKQEALSVGGDFITSKDLILARKEHYCGILIATQNELEKLIAKCRIQPFGLKKLAFILKEHLDYGGFDSMSDSSDFVDSSKFVESSDFSSKGDSATDSSDSADSSKVDSSDFTAIKKAKIPQIMGIINITEDSFYADSRITNIDKILQVIESMIESKVAIIDIGGASSRPDSTRVESSEELGRLKAPLKAIYEANLTQKAIFSIDSYNYECVKYAIECGFSIINDIEGLRDMRLAELAKESGSKIVLMHNSWLYPHSGNIIRSVDEFFTKRVESLLNLGIKREQIILDVGFGFGKNSGENLALVRNLAHFKHFGCSMLMGASMKRTIGEVVDRGVNERLFGTLALHQIALDNGADIIRCHDFKAHSDMLKMWLALR